jgi:hypothetical protein
MVSVVERTGAGMVSAPATRALVGLIFLFVLLGGVCVLNERVVVGEGLVVLAHGVTDVAGR